MYHPLVAGGSWPQDRSSRPPARPVGPCGRAKNMASKSRRAAFGCGVLLAGLSLAEFVTGVALPLVARYAASSLAHPSKDRGVSRVLGDVALCVLATICSGPRTTSSTARGTALAGRSPIRR